MKILSALGLLTLLVVAVPSGLVWMALGPVALGSLAALLMLLRRNQAPSMVEGTERVPHRGINVTRISPAGFPGLVFAFGFIWMFWFGVPGFRPVVIGIAIVGCLAGVLLVAIEQRHRLPTSTPLGLSAHQPHRKSDAVGKASVGMRPSAHSRILLADFANLGPDEHEELARVVAGHRGLDDIFAWGRQQSPPIHPADVVRQDEFTHDVLVPFPHGRWLVYGTT